jgi:hypothetical protein
MPARRAQRHFVDVWNPAYASNAMEAHLAVLLEAAKRYERREVVEDALHVWWGKIRSRHRHQELTHLSQVLEIAAELAADESRECHLYLTDYNSLYVAQVDAVTQDDIRTSGGAQLPDYYRDPALTCDFWYRLLDIRRLVADDTGMVIAELRALRNLGYHDMPVSLYGGMVDLPLIVERTDGRRYFDDENRDRITDGKLWAELDADQVGVGAIERELRDNLFGEEVWTALDPAARTFIASAEKVYRDQRADPGFDYGLVIADLAKALEVTVNAVLRRAATKIAREVRQVTVDDKRLDLADGKHLALGQLAHLLRRKGTLERALRRQLEHGDWLVDVFPGVLAEVVQLRNPAVHSQRIGRVAATRLRNKLVGVGCQGIFTDLARVRIR